MVQLLGFLRQQNKSKPARESKTNNRGKKIRNRKSLGHEDNIPSGVECIGGVYIATSFREGSSESESVKAHNISINASKDDDSATTDSTESSSWRSSGTKSFRSKEELREEKRKRAREMDFEGTQNNSSSPGLWYYSSNHVMINKEREKRGVTRMTRESELDEIARRRAAEMAEMGSLNHGDPLSLQCQLSNPYTRLGENVALGGTIRDINMGMMEENVADKNNILDRRFKYMGIGTARGKDGRLYLCQIFRG